MKAGSHSQGGRTETRMQYRKILIFKKYLVLKKHFGSDLLRGHGEQGGDAQGDPGGDSVGVEPEADPGHDDEHAAGHVDCQQVVGELPLEGEVHREAAVLA